MAEWTNFRAAGQNQRCAATERCVEDKLGAPRSRNQPLKQFEWQPEKPEIPMSLSEAQSIMEAVKRDAKCRNLITSPLRYLPAPWAGWTRDAKVMGRDILQGMLRPVSTRGKSEEEIRKIVAKQYYENSDEVCGGIADATKNAIMKANLPFVLGTTEVTRDGGYFTEAGMIVGTHYATGIDLAGFQAAGHLGRRNSPGLTGANRPGPMRGRVVFDWWATMDLDDPLLYPSPEDFKRADNAIRFSEWQRDKAGK